MLDEKSIRKALARTEDRASWLSRELERTIGHRDRLLSELLDSTGASSQRVTYPANSVEG